MFLNPIMLAGLAGAMLPLVLHLLGRARYRNVRWGAMIFLGIDDLRHAQRPRFKEVVLLLIRMALVALLAIALARPVLGPRGLADGPTCTVIVLDHSGSMGMQQNGPPRMEVARRAALDVLSNLRRGDEAAVVVTPEVGAPAALTTDLQLLAENVNGPRNIIGRADIAKGLATAAELFAQSNASLKHLVVISDRQAVSWQQVTEDFSRKWRQDVSGTSARPPLFTVIPIGGDDAGNVAIESVRVVDPPVVRGLAAQIEVHVHNYDSLPNTGLDLTIVSREGVELYRRTLNLDAQASATVQCPVNFNTVGPMILTTRINPSGLQSDDTMDVALEVSDPIGVLVVSGDERDSLAAPFRSEADFVRLALSPYDSDRHPGPNFGNVQVAAAESWPELDRASRPVVILANVPQIEPTQARQLEQFVYGGGGLLIASGNLTQITDYNNQLWRGGSGLMPAALLAPVASDGSEATSLLGVDLSHPIMRFLREWDDPVPRASIRRYFPVEGLASQSIVPVRYASGLPFFIERSYGRGRVLLMTTPLDADWNNLPLSPVYLPLVQSMVRYLAAGTVPQWNVWMGEPLVAMIENPLEPTASLDGPRLPNTQPLPVPLVRVGDGFEARYTNVSRQGIYRLNAWTQNGQRQIAFAVRAPRDESNMTALTKNGWETLRRSLGFEFVPADAQAIAQVVRSSRQRFELSSYLIAAVLLLAIGELGLSRLWATTPTEPRS